ncbi:MAG TPA: ABC transporter permease [Candidatus Acidoferrum sp.]|nr:ABC transporter permease [Candidatus Acidoferrum sp.]
MSKVSVLEAQMQQPVRPEAHVELHAPRAEWLSELWRYRELLYFLAWRDVKVRYKQASLGAAWAVIQPLITMVIFAFFFGRLANIPSDGVPYPLFCYCALVPWLYFSSTLTQAGNSLVSNSNLITKVYFPRVLLPAASVLSGLLDFAIGSSFLVVLMFYYKVRPGWSLLLWPVAVLSLTIVSLGISMLLAGLNVRYRDVKYVIPFIVQLGLFVTPVIYPASFLPARVRPWLALNPMTGIVELFRASLFVKQPINLPTIVISVVATVLLSVLGAMYFGKAERSFADII